MLTKRGVISMSLRSSPPPLPPLLPSPSFSVLFGRFLLSAHLHFPLPPRPFRYTDFHVNEVSEDGSVVRLSRPLRPGATFPAAEGASAGPGPVSTPAALLAALRVAAPEAVLEGDVTRFVLGNWCNESDENIQAAKTEAGQREATGGSKGEGCRAEARSVSDAPTKASPLPADGAPSRDGATSPSVPAPTSVLVGPIRDKASRGAVHRLFREAGARLPVESDTVDAAQAPESAGNAREAIDGDDARMLKRQKVEPKGAERSETVEMKDAAEEVAATLSPSPLASPCPVAASAGAGAPADAAGTPGDSLPQYVRVWLTASGRDGRAKGGGKGAGRGRGRGRGRGGGGGRGGSSASSSSSHGRRPPPLPPGMRATRFALLKENMETQSVLSLLSTRLHVPLKAFGFAGTKDKRGCTTQLVTVERVGPERLARGIAGLRNILLGDCEMVPEPLALGALGGNRFAVALRDLQAKRPEERQEKGEGAVTGEESGEGSRAVAGDPDPDAVAPLPGCRAPPPSLDLRSLQRVALSACASLSSRGFVNYFGMQRFGVGAVSTDRIGGKLLAGDWWGAVRLVLRARGGRGGGGYAELFARGALGKDEEEGRAEEVKGKCAAEGDDSSGGAGAASPPASEAISPASARALFAAALRGTPARDVAEKAVLGRLSSDPRDALGALRAVPRHVRSMYLHAVQSRLWNEAASERIERGGAERVCVGDLVVARPGLPLGSANSALETDVRLITEQDVKNGHPYGIGDVILPLPGACVVYPETGTGKPSQAFLRAAARLGGGAWTLPPGRTVDGAAEHVEDEKEKEEEKTTEENARETKSVSREFSFGSLTGAYRHLVALPRELRCRVVAYDDPNQDLIPSDIERIESNDRHAKEKGGESSKSAAKQNTKEDTTKDADKDAGKDDDDKGSAVSSQHASPGELGPLPAAIVDGAPAEFPRTASASSPPPAQAPTQSPPPQHLALLLAFSLPPSSYATMLFRELTKVSSADHHLLGHS